MRNLSVRGDPWSVSRDSCSCCVLPETNADLPNYAIHNQLRSTQLVIRKSARSTQLVVRNPQSARSTQLVIRNPQFVSSTFYLTRLFRDGVLLVHLANRDFDGLLHGGDTLSKVADSHTLVAAARCNKGERVHLIRD